VHLQEYPGECASPVSRPSLIRDLNHVFTLLRVEKQSWGDKFVIWEEFMRPWMAWNRKIGKTGYQKNSSETTLGGGGSPPTAPPPLWTPVIALAAGTFHSTQ